MDVLLVTLTAHDSGVVLRDGHLLGRTQHLDGSLLKLQTLLLRDNHTTCQYGDVFQHSLAAVAKTRSLHSANLQLSAQTVHHQSSECLALHILSNHEDRTTCLCSRVQDRQELLQVADFLVVDEDERVLHLTLHLLRVSHEVRRQITTIELHAFYHTDSGFTALSLFDGDDTVL